jgi:P-type Cu+ transporter
MELSLSVSGMSCAACSRKIERAVSELRGVETCDISLATHSARVRIRVGDEGIGARDVIEVIEVSVFPVPGSHVKADIWSAESGL